MAGWHTNWCAVCSKIFLLEETSAWNSSHPVCMLSVLYLPFVPHTLVGPYTLTSYAIVVTGNSYTTFCKWLLCLIVARITRNSTGINLLIDLFKFRFLFNLFSWRGNKLEKENGLCRETNLRQKFNIMYRISCSPKCQCVGVYIFNIFERKYNWYFVEGWFRLQLFL